MTANALLGRDLCYRVDDRAVLTDVAVEAFGGEPLAVMGSSGAGKSTLLAILGGLLEPDGGAVTLDGRSVCDDRARADIGFVLQNYGLIDVFTAWENVAISLQARGFTRFDIVARTTAKLAAVGLADLAGQPANALSGGQRQRLAVARALVTDPVLVLADEPTAELDAENRAIVLDQLLAAAARGAIVLIASHDPEVAARCGAQLLLVDGMVVEEETAPRRGG